MKALTRVKNKMPNFAGSLGGIKKIIVCSPAVVTGGPELLHQLVGKLNELGYSAHIAYYPFGACHETPEPYRRYKVPVGEVEDDGGTLIVIPEAATRLRLDFRKSRVAIWWLSVDNYLGVRRDSWLEDFLLGVRALISRRLPLFMLRRCFHLTQSEYARQYLISHGIHSMMLGDYLSGEHFVKSSPSCLKRNVIAFNPKKGRRITIELIRKFPEFKFVPIENMSAKDVANLLCGAKLYVDFGNHPGKDRVPREAAMAGCCVITGRKGAARFYEDIPIPDKYKLNEGRRDFFDAFGELCSDVLENYSDRVRDFDAYREKIASEPVNFDRQVCDVFRRLTLP